MNESERFVLLIKKERGDLRHEVHRPWKIQRHVQARLMMNHSSLFKYHIFSLFCFVWFPFSRGEFCASQLNNRDICRNNSYWQLHVLQTASFAYWIRIRILNWLAFFFWQRGWKSPVSFFKLLKMLVVWASFFSPNKMFSDTNRNTELQEG